MMQELKCLNFQDSMIFIKDNYIDIPEKRNELLADVIFNKMKKGDKIAITKFLSISKLSEDLQGGIFEAYLYNDIVMNKVYVCNLLITTPEEALILAQNISCLDFRRSDQLSLPSGDKNPLEPVLRTLKDKPLSDEDDISIINDILNGVVRDKDLIFDILVNTYPWMVWPGIESDRNAAIKNCSILIKKAPALISNDEPGFDSYIDIYNIDGRDLDLKKFTYRDKEYLTYDELKDRIGCILLEPVRKINIKRG